MKKILSISLILLMAAGLLAACSKAESNTSSTTSTGNLAATPGADQLDASNIQRRLALGTLMLEGSANAITKEQAATLLPLGKAVKSLGSSDTATAQEISALYTQIQESMTTEQTAAIQAMDMSQENMAALMDKLGIQMPGPVGDAANLTADERATRVAEFQQRAGSNETRGQGGGPGGQGGFSGGGPGGGDGGGFITNGQPPSGGDAPRFDSQIEGGQFPGAQGTPMPGATGGVRMNNLFVDPVINLLKERAGS